MQRMSKPVVICGMLLAAMLAPCIAGDKELEGLLGLATGLDDENHRTLNVEDITRIPVPATVRRRESWWESERSQVEKWESTPVCFEGYLYSASEEEVFWSKEPVTMITVGNYQSGQESNNQSTGLPVVKGYINQATRQEKKDWKLDSFRPLKGQKIKVFGRLVWDNFQTREWLLIITRIYYFENNLQVELR